VKFGITPHIQFSTTVLTARFGDSDSLWVCVSLVLLFARNPWVHLLPSRHY
jgi:hypothetical protein